MIRFARAVSSNFVVSPRSIARVAAVPSLGAVALGAILLGAIGLSGMAGCSGRTEIFPNSDPALRKTPAEFAADAAKRFPYQADAPSGGQALARAQAEYVRDQLDLINLSDTDWTNVEVWVNGTHVVFLPVMEAKVMKIINFRQLYNDQGQHFTTRNGNESSVISKVELVRDGTRYTVPVQMAE